MAEKTVSRESVIKRSIEGTCSSIAFIISHSSNEEFRNAVMDNFKVKDTVEFKKELSYKLNEIGKHRYGINSQNQITDRADLRNNTMDTNGSHINETSEDSWSKLEQILFTDDSKTPTSDETNNEAINGNKEIVALAISTDVPSISNKSQTAKYSTADIDEESTCANNMTSSDLSQITEGFQKVSPFCQLAVESPSYNSSHSDSDSDGKLVFGADENSCNLLKTDAAEKVNDIYSVNRFDLNTSSKQIQKFQYGVYSQPISAVQLNSSKMTSHSQKVANVSETVLPNISNCYSTLPQLKYQNSQSDKLTQEIPCNNYSSDSPMFFNKRFKYDDNIDQSNCRSKFHVMDQVEPNRDEPKSANNDDWFDNVLLDIEDWLN
ncbi:hypothetical protein ACF0H5_002139 [Mactra antiquata]